ncbi:hypothetical protein [Archaeoglobus fulgidus]|nr:hypothetical protein [Archaeoglobus fulgidus]
MGKKKSSKKHKKFKKTKPFKPKKKPKTKYRKKRRSNWLPVLSLSAAVGSSYLRYQLNLGYLVGVSAIFWTIFMLSLYTRLLRRINRIDLRDDLNLWGLRIAGGLMIGVGLLFGVFMASVSAVFGEPFMLGISILIVGLVIPGAFALFRSTRRYPIVHIGFLK